ncbi:type-F conjugative transfer system secretin TraK [Methylocaldum szegediense]|uniref:TraK domain-containing protein n=1 Tax=Methylocaldum szegediense TaxID=73780 RepID=UPI00055EC1D5|nr:type-F conjugative transfer system secretin TraK [Methylocaldum szegediense]
MSDRTVRSNHLVVALLMSLSMPLHAEPDPAAGVELLPVSAKALQVALRQAETEEPTTLMPETVKVSPGVNELLPVAVGHLNRIVTPFDHPVVTTVSNAQTQTRGRVVYVAPNDETPITLYLTPGDNPEFALSLTLIPKRIPAREIRLTLDDESSKTLGKIQLKTKDDRGEGGVGIEPPEYVAQLKTIFRELGLQRTPRGFELREPEPSERIRCGQPALEIRTGQALEGRDMVILVGIARNRGYRTLEIDERTCAEIDGSVLAVASWPKVVLEPDEATELYVARRRSPEEEVMSRPSLLEGGVLR